MNDTLVSKLHREMGNSRRIRAIWLLRAASLIFGWTESNERFTEELFIRTLEDGKVASTFTFETRLTADSTQRNRELFDTDGSLPQICLGLAAF
jgi:hypothetical protein